MTDAEAKILAADGHFQVVAISETLYARYYTEDVDDLVWKLPCDSMRDDELSQLVIQVRSRAHTATVWIAVSGTDFLQRITLSTLSKEVESERKIRLPKTQEDAEDKNVTCLAVHDGAVLVGTSKGRWIWVSTERHGWSTQDLNNLVESSLLSRLMLKTTTTALAVTHMTLQATDTPHTYTATRLDADGAWSMYQITTKPSLNITRIAQYRLSDGANVVAVAATSQGGYHAIGNTTSGQLSWITLQTNGNQVAHTVVASLKGSFVGLKAAPSGVTYLALQSHTTTNIYAYDGAKLQHMTLSDTRARALALDGATLGVTVWTASDGHAFFVELPVRHVPTSSTSTATVEQLVAELQRTLQYSETHPVILEAWHHVDARHEHAILQVLPTVPRPTRLVELLLVSGVQRWLSPACKWKLYSASQHAVVQATLQTIQQTHNEDILDTLARVQSQSGFVDVLCKVLGKLVDLRAAAPRTYLLDPDTPPTVESDPLVWSTRLFPVLRHQIASWSSNQVSVDADTASLIVSEFLQAARDLHLSIPRNAQYHAQYLKALEDGLAYLRGVNKDDAMAFRLCKDHAYFQGVCVISMDHHERKRMLEFSLAPLFDDLAGECDVATGQPFDEFVLQWLFEHGYDGLALKLGRSMCVETLEVMINDIASLRKYRYLCAIDKGDFDSAAAYQLEAVADAPLKDATLAANMARLANLVSQKEQEENNRTASQTARNRADKIAAKRELVTAQRLVADNMSAPLLDARKLVPRLVAHAANAPGDEEASKLLLAALGCCMDMGSENRVDAVVQVWVACLVKNEALWVDLVERAARTDDRLIQDEILTQTVYGRLLTLQKALKASSKDLPDDLKCRGEVRARVLERIGQTAGWNARGMTCLLQLVE